jgi:hypothetical protein
MSSRGGACIACNTPAARRPEDRAGYAGRPRTGAGATDAVPAQRLVPAVRFRPGSASSSRLRSRTSS